MLHAPYYHDHDIHFLIELTMKTLDDGALTRYLALKIMFNNGLDYDFIWKWTLSLFSTTVMSIKTTINMLIFLSISIQKN